MKCKYCKDTGKVLLLFTYVDCECKIPENIRKNLIATYPNLEDYLDAVKKWTSITKVDENISCS